MARRPVSAAVAVIAVIAALAGVAGANGRPPMTNGVFFGRGEAAPILARTTFGLLISRDGGCSFRWVCEAAISAGGRFDPKYAVAEDGTIFASTVTGLRVSRDGGCTWTTATAERRAGDPGRIAGIWIDALELSPEGHVWVATAESGRPNDVYRSTDGGETFAPRGLASPAIWWKSVRVAASDPRRVYVTGYQVGGPPLPDGRPQPPAAHLRRSDDAGAHWRSTPLPDVRFGATPIVYAPAVDPANADVVMLTSLGANPPAGDRLYRSSDGGATFREVLATEAAISDVVFHGGKVYVATVRGSFVSADGGATFAPLPNAPQLACLGSRGGELLGCGANWQPDDKALARSADGGAAWQKVFRFVDLAGPLACPKGTTTFDACEALWPGLQQQFGATGPAAACPAPPPMPVPAPRKKQGGGGGCCDGGGGDGGGGALGAAALAGWLAAITLRGRRWRRWRRMRAE